MLQELGTLGFSIFLLHFDGMLANNTLEAANDSAAIDVFFDFETILLS